MSERLTPREQQVAQVVLRRFTRKAAPPLDVDDPGLQPILEDVYRKLKISTPLELLLCAYSGVLQIASESEEGTAA
jgi:hypothetical protein